MIISTKNGQHVPLELLDSHVGQMFMYKNADCAHETNV